MKGFCMDYTQLEDSELLQMFADEGDNEAFQVLHQRFNSELHGFLFKECKVFGPEINDILQDVWVRVVCKAHLYNPQYSARNWLYRVTERVVLTNWTHESRQKRGGPDTRDFNLTDAEIRNCIENRRTGQIVNGPLQALLDDEQRKQIQEIIAQLPEEEQQAVNLVYLDGLTQKEAATMLGISIDTIAIQLKRARVLLRRLLANLVQH